MSGKQKAQILSHGGRVTPLAQNTLSLSARNRSICATGIAAARVPGEPRPPGCRAHIEHRQRKRSQSISVSRFCARPCTRWRDTTNLCLTSNNRCLSLRHAGKKLLHQTSALFAPVYTHIQSAAVSLRINCYSLAPAIKVEFSSIPTKMMILANRYLPSLQSAN